MGDMKNIIPIILVYKMLLCSNLFAMSRAELVVGKYYKIHGEIPLHHKPEVLINKTEFKNNFIECK